MNTSTVQNHMKWGKEMPVYKNSKNGSWYVMVRYTDWRGERKQKCQRGFTTKKEAQEWERQFLLQKKADIDMTLESFCELYEKDVRPRLKLNTWLTKEHIIKAKILPYFGKRKLSEITAKDVIDWQNEIRTLKTLGGKTLSPTYLKTIHAQELICKGWFLPPNTYDCGSFVVNGTAVIGKKLNHLNNS